jgi:serine/arginine repetitive matrix protein 2
MGMSGLREMLKALKKTHADHPPPLPSSSASASTESSIDSHNQHYYPHPQIQTHRRRPKTSTGPESIKSTRNQHQDPTSPYNVPSLTHKSSPRRPSLASIFRIGQKSKTSVVGPDSSMDSITQAQTASKSSDRSSTMEEEDWDRMDSASDLEHAAKALALADGTATVKCKKGYSPYLQIEQQQRPGTCSDTPKIGHTASRSSILSADDRSPQSVQHTRSTRLSNVEENVDDYRGLKSFRNGKKRASLPAPSPSTPRSRKGLKTDSVRSAPPQSLAGNEALQSISDFKLAMTPENIKPLLENAREVHTRLNECLAELRALLA